VPVLWVPLAALDPLQSPLAVHEVGLLVTLQVKVELLPVVTDIGLALKLITGAGGRATVSATFFIKPLPPALVQDKLYT
jgi:hypothetical protein